MKRQIFEIISKKVFPSIIKLGEQSLDRPCPLNQSKSVREFLHEKGLRMEPVDTDWLEAYL